MLRDSALSMLSTSVRLLTSLVLFVVLAHVWGPDSFGVFMYPYTVAAVLVKIVDYGFALQLARDVGRSPGRVQEIVGRALGAKIVLVVPTLVTAAVVGVRMGASRSYGWLLALLLLDALATSFALFVTVPLRALGRFDREASIATTANLALFAASVGAVLAGGGPVVVAIAFLGTRIGFLALSLRGYALTAGGLPRPSFERRAVLDTLKVGFPFGVYVVVGTLNLQTDTLVVQHYLGAAAVGLYQAGMRLLFGGLLVADALHNVYITSLARAAHEQRELDRLATRMTRHLLAIGVIGFACLLAGNQWIVALLFAEKFAPLADLVPLFGLLVLVRYAGISYGTVLTLADQQTLRVVAATAVLALSLALNILLIPRFGLRGALTASILSHVTLYSVYAAAAWRDYRSLLMDRRSAALLLGAAATLPLLAFPGSVDVAVRVAAGLSLVLASIAVGVTGDEWSVLSRKLTRSAQAA